MNDMSIEKHLELRNDFKKQKSLEKLDTSGYILWLENKLLSLPQEQKEPTLEVCDIRNKLSPITHLIQMIELGETNAAITVLHQAKISVNYLAQKERFSITEI